MKRASALDTVYETTAAVLRTSGRFSARAMTYDLKINQRVAKAFRRKLGAKKSDDLAFHICDWNHDAAFVTALSINPKAFSDAEVRAGVELLLIHVPWHVGEACKVSGGGIVPDDYPKLKRRRVNR